MPTNIGLRYVVGRTAIAGLPHLISELSAAYESLLAGLHSQPFSIMIAGLFLTSIRVLHGLYLTFTNTFSNLWSRLEYLNLFELRGRAKVGWTEA